MFQPLRTDRLVVRPLRIEEAAALHAWRNDPAVAHYQAWVLPFELERAEEMVRTAIELGGPADERWWTAAVEHAESGQLLGELVVNLTNAERTAEVGYTFIHDAWGHGYAVEALTALVDWLFGAFPITRVWGGLHPDNRASAMVLERTGLLFEGHNRLSFWLGDENSDDWVYGMTRDDWRQWRSRPVSTPDSVALVPVTPDNSHAVRALRTHRSQQAFVAPVEQSFADALVPELVNGAPVVPWLRAVEADGELVGFVMLALATEHHPEPFLWRLLVDRLHQRRGIGTRALNLVIAECRARGAGSLLVSWSEGKGSPGPFYRAHGFVPTGALVDGQETEARLDLSTTVRE